jgi:lactoylglutathione lyase
MKHMIAAFLLTFGLAACGGEAARPAQLVAAAVSALAPKDPLLSAVGIGVSDLQKSTDFYINVMGMQKIKTYELEALNEVVLGYPEGESYIVLMNWHDGTKRNYKDLPVKVVTRTKDPAALAAKIKAAGFTVTREPSPSAQVGNAIVGLAKDPDGYVLELLPLRTPIAPPAPAKPATPSNG